MRARFAAAAALGLMAFTSGPPEAPDDSPRVTNPDWARRPSGEDIARYYPDRAQRLELEGSATVVCRVGVDGRLRDCEIAEETPADAGFGDATVRLAEREFRMTPKTVDGVPVDGAFVRIPLVYKLPEGPQGTVIRLDGPYVLIALGGLIGTGMLLLGVILFRDLRRRPTDL